jgi:DNA-binding NtrC family response regulator
MGSSPLVLLISVDGDFAGVVRKRVLGIENIRVRVFQSVYEAIARTAAALPGLIAIHLRGGVTDAQVAYLLGKATLPQQQVPVVVISDHYDTERALALFRLGVTDYISRSDHLDRLPSLVDALMVRKSRRASGVPQTTWKQCLKRWKVSSLSS